MRPSPPHAPSLSYRALAGEAARLLLPHKRLTLAVIAMQAAVALAVGLADPLLMAAVIESLTDGDVARFGLFVALAIGLATALRGLGYVSALLMRRLTNVLTEDLVAQAFEAFSERAHPDVATHESGYHTSRIFDEPSRVASSLLVVTSIVQNSLLAAVGLAVCLSLAWEVSLALGVIVPVLVYLSRRYGARVARETVQGDEEEAALRAHVGRSVGGHLTAQLFRLHGVSNRYVSGALQTLLGTRYRRTQEAARLNTTSALFLSYAETSVLVGAGFQVLRGGLSIGGLFGFTKAFWHVVNATRSLVDLIPKVAIAQGQFSRHVEYRDGGGSPSAEAPVVHDALTLDAVAFDHGDGALFEGVSFQVEPGERVLLRGPNGVGKSTLARIAAGALRPSGGRRTGPGTTSALLLPFGFPPGTVAEHLRLGARSDADRARIEALARDLGLAALLDRDPAQLSQGEQRRFQVLLTLGKRADLYVFDEPLSNVDDEGRERLMDIIFEETAGASVLMVLHGDGHHDVAFDRVVEMRPGAGGACLEDDPAPTRGELSAAL